jgi:hypothetical protein
MKDIIVFQGLTKQHGRLLAVDHISLNIDLGVGSH